jgi:predicted SprT family Zn-dependent metalloprotease
MPNTAPPNLHRAGQIRASILKFCGLWGVEEIQDDIQVEFSSRLTRSLGRTQPLRKVIRLNNELRTTLNGHLEEVICHELAHVATVHLYGPSIKPHGEEWQTLVRLAGFEPSIRLWVDGQWTRDRAPRRYKHYCPVCHSQRIGRIRMTRWRCSACVANGLAGELQIEEMA